MSLEHRASALIAVAGILAVLGVATMVVLRWSPIVPPTAASVPLGRTALVGPIGPDVGGDDDPALVPRSPAGQACLPRVDAGGGYIDACWAAHRYPADGDSEKDYYLLDVYATFGSDGGGSPRWAILRADLDGTPADGVLEAWPDGEFDATCEPAEVHLWLVDPGTEVPLCGHITAVEAGRWSRSVTWTCQGCLLPDDRDRQLSLYVGVAVPAGTIPAWDIFADVGG